MKAFRVVYAILSWLFVASVLLQVFLAGMVVVARQISWDYHRVFGVLIWLSLILLIVAAYLAGLPRRMKGLTWLLFGVLTVQILFLVTRGSIPALSALHPVMALVDFVLGLYLARMATKVMNEPLEQDTPMVFQERQRAG